MPAGAPRWPNAGSMAATPGSWPRPARRLRPPEIRNDSRFMPTDQITIRGAREHNLKNVTLSIPRDKLVVFTGLSGAGKSSLAFATIYAHGQRRDVDYPW